MKGGVGLYITEHYIHEWQDFTLYFTSHGCRSHWTGCMIVVIWCCHVRRYMQVCHVMLQNLLAFWLAEQLRWVETNFEEVRKVDQCSDEMKTVEENLLRWHVRRDGMRWEEMRWSVECEVRSAKCEVCSAGCEERSATCEESVRWALHCTGVARRSCSQTTTAQQVRTNHARMGLGGARRMQVL